LDTGDAVFRSAIARARKLMGKPIAILLQGESGVGKEVFARAAHRSGPRGEQPFVAVNCAALPENLIEAELFGYQGGAFTGARREGAPGRIREAHGGTLFLDEIGDMPFELQTRLLRVLSDGHFYRVGGHSAVKTNVRVIAATHQDLEQRVKEGVFREDLFHRLNVIRLRLPALRERREDIAMLTRHFLQQSAQQLGVDPKRISDASLSWLEQFQFPGNVRQLENICHWLTVMAPAQVIEPKDLPPEVGVLQAHDTPPSVGTPDASASPLGLSVAEIRPVAVAPGTPLLVGSATGWESELEAEATALLSAGQSNVWDALTHRFESRLILAALANTKGRRIEAAQKLGIGRNTITRKIQELGLE
jgi:two-component system nitrogen regulation response regulator GlnG